MSSEYHSTSHLVCPFSEKILLCYQKNIAALCGDKHNNNLCEEYKVLHAVSAFYVWRHQSAYDFSSHQRVIECSHYTSDRLSQFTLLRKPRKNNPLCHYALGAIIIETLI